MDFTKQYIKECDCESIQELRVKGLRNFDIYVERFDIEKDRYNEIHVMTLSSNYESVGRLGGEIYLPTGDQLNDEIVKLMNNSDDLLLDILIDCKGETEVNLLDNSDDDCSIYGKHYKNPLIAKIKLLKLLFKETS